MNIKQLLLQKRQKQCDARWHHINLPLIHFYEELKTVYFSQLYVLKKIFIFALWCDVCGTSLYLGKLNPSQKVFKLINKTRNNLFLFLRSLPNFLGKSFLKI